MTWKESTDYLRCNNAFFNHPRYDFVIVQTVEGPIFARLVCIICFAIEGNEYPVALIHPCDKWSGPQITKDIDLGFTRVQFRPRHESEFVSVHSIIRGAVLVPAFRENSDEDMLVLDVLDTDMFVRIRKMLNLW